MMSSRCSAASPLEHADAERDDFDRRKMLAAIELVLQRRAVKIAHRKVQEIPPGQRQHIGEVMRVHPLQKPLFGEQPARGIGIALQHGLQGFECPALAALRMARTIHQGVARTVDFFFDDELIEPCAGLQLARQRQFVRVDHRRRGVAHFHHAHHQGAGVVLPASGMGSFHQRFGDALRRIVQLQ